MSWPQGLVQAVGVSNYGPQQLQRIHRHAPLCESAWKRFTCTTECCLLAATAFVGPHDYLLYVEMHTYPVTPGG